MYADFCPGTLTQSAFIIVVNTVVTVVMMIRDKNCPKGGTREIHVACKVIYQMQSLPSNEHRGQNTSFVMCSPLCSFLRRCGESHCIVHMSPTLGLGGAMNASAITA